MAKLPDPIIKDLKELLVEGVTLTGKELGVGAYGCVDEAEAKIAGKSKTVAVKRLHSQLVVNVDPTHPNSSKSNKWVADFVEECKLMSKLHHPHIVEFLGICSLPGCLVPGIIMEKLQTSLHTLLDTVPGIDLNVKIKILWDISKGIKYLHSQAPPIAHRDLTAKNVLLVESPVLTAKIADLGVARIVTIQPGKSAATMTNTPGTSLYMPPECVSQDHTAVRYSTAIDVFSFGIVSLFTLTQTFPCYLSSSTYFCPDTRELCARSEIDRRDKYIHLMQTSLTNDHHLVQMTLSCLHCDPEKRPSAGDLATQLCEQAQGHEHVKFHLPAEQQLYEPQLQLNKEQPVKEKKVQLSEKQPEKEKAQHTEKNPETEKVQLNIEQPEKEKETQKKPFKWWKVAAVGGAAVVGGAGAVVAAPFVLGALGFTSAGIAAGSIGASMMSAMGPVASGSLVATLQSVGAAGLGAAGTAAVGGTGAVVTGAAAGAAVTLAGKSGEGESKENSSTATEGDDASDRNEQEPKGAPAPKQKQESGV